MALLTNDMAAALRNNNALAVLAEIGHPSGTARFWTGIGTLTWNSLSWTGAGTLGAINPVQRSSDLAIQEVTFELAGVEPDQLSFIDETVRNFIAKAWLACLDDRGNVIRDPYQLLTAELDYQSFNIDEQGTGRLSVTGRTGFYTLERALDEVWSPEDQKQSYPTDTGLDFIPKLQNLDLVWKP